MNISQEMREHTRELQIQRLASLAKKNEICKEMYRVNPDRSEEFFGDWQEAVHEHDMLRQYLEAEVVSC